MIKFEFIPFNPFSDEVDNYDVIGVRAHLDEGETVTFGRYTFTKDFFMGIEFAGVKRIDDVVDEDTCIKFDGLCVSTFFKVVVHAMCDCRFFCLFDSIHCVILY
jgi:hypothetical protein